MAEASNVQLYPTPRYYTALGRAAEIVRSTNSPSVMAEHLYLAIIHDRGALPTQVIAELVNLDQLEATVLDAINASGSSPSETASPQLQGEAGGGMWGSGVALEMEHSYIGVEHAFLDLIRDREGVPAQALARLIDPGLAESAIRDVLDSPGYRGDPSTEDSQKQFLPEGQELDEPLLEAIRECVPEGATFGVNWENGQPWIHVSDPGDSRNVLAAALTRVGRTGLD